MCNELDVTIRKMLPLMSASSPDLNLTEFLFLKCNEISLKEYINQHNNEHCRVFIEKDGQGFKYLIL